MTKDEIIEIAKSFLWGGNVVEGWTFNSYEQLESFAKLVAEHERKACARLCAEVGMWELVHEIEARGQE
jgi:hypothetical protein